MIDNKEISLILEKLESLEDDDLAVKLLAEFNNQSKVYGKLILNLDKSLSHDDWKKQCELEQEKLNSIINKIKSL